MRVILCCSACQRAGHDEARFAEFNVRSSVGPFDLARTPADSPETWTWTCKCARRTCGKHDVRLSWPNVKALIDQRQTSRRVVRIFLP